MITVAELIAKLQEMPRDKMVMIEYNEEWDSDHPLKNIELTPWGEVYLS